ADIQVVPQKPRIKNAAQKNLYDGKAEQNSQEDRRVTELDKRDKGRHQDRHDGTHIRNEVKDKSHQPPEFVEIDLGKAQRKISGKAGQDAYENRDADVTLHLHVDVFQDAQHMLFRFQVLYHLCDLTLEKALLVKQETCIEQD